MRRPLRPKRVFFRSLAYVLLVAGSILVVVPFLMMVLGSFKDAREAAEMSIALPSVWHFENYAQVFARANILRAMRNSIVITFLSVAVTVLAASTAAFYFGRVGGRRARVISNLFYLGLIAPPAIVTSIKLLQFLGISGTYLGVILVFSAMNIPFAVFLIAGLVKTIPRELDEAAVIDGCSPAGLFFRVVFPLLAPVVATASIVVFMAVWNSFMIPLYFLNQSTKWTMPLTVYGFFGQFLSDWHLVFTDLLLTAAPVNVVYAVAQKYIIEGIATGAVKG
jgi:raffinose/stachyose/melibiose transport system permease protein